ncbi:hypothetical protein ACO2Q7_02315 [Rathayibacter sp. KR2-224]|uniref:hypothetical protein n=1 Tax=Rathayibacter sp. KR2-224 TaxID=3400913 RepID=UPI003BFD77A0
MTTFAELPLEADDPEADRELDALDAGDLDPDDRDPDPLALAATASTPFLVPVATSAYS